MENSIYEAMKGGHMEQTARTIIIDKDAVERYQAAGDKVIDILALECKFNPGECMYVMITLMQAIEDLLELSVKKEVVH